MEFAKLEPDLQQWISDAVKNGQRLSVMVDALLKAGYQPGIAHAVEQCLVDFESKRTPSQLPATETSLQLEQQTPAQTSHQTAQQTTQQTGPFAGHNSHLENDMADGGQRFRIFEPSSNLIDLGDRQVEVQLVLQQPNVILFSNLLSDSECDALIEMARPQLKRSRVVNPELGTFDKQEIRTSSGTFFKRAVNPLVAGIESRIAGLVGVAESRGEVIQVMHYKVGAEYKPHFDFFDPEKTGNKKVLSSGGQRVGTMIMYLNNVEAGGSTVFPEIGLDILPKKGSGLFFSYANEAGQLDYQTLHGGSPVIDGEKWIATKWLRQRDYESRRG